MSEVKPQKRLLTPFLSKYIPPVPTEDERLWFPRNANFLSKVFVWWIHPVIRVGYKRTVVPEDMFKLTDDLKVETLTVRFNKYFNTRLEKAKAKHIAGKAKKRANKEKADDSDAEDDLADFVVPKYIVGYALLETFAYQYGLACFFLTISTCASCLSPLLTRRLINYVQLKALGSQESDGVGVGLAIGTALLVLVTGLAMNHSFQKSMMTGAQVKAVLTKCLLDKYFRLSGESRLDHPKSRITSVMGTDLARIDMALGFQPFIFTFPITMAISIAILCFNIGAPAMVGIDVAFVVLAATMYSTKKLFQYRRSANILTDARVKCVKEILNNLKIIKFYSWEKPYFARITKSRNAEMKIIYIMQVARNMIIALSSSLTAFASMSSFLVLYAIRNNSTRNSATIFASLSLFNIFSLQLFMLPIALATGSDAIIGIIRSGEILAAEEIDPVLTAIEASPEMKVQMDAQNLAIKVDKASFCWETKNPLIPKEPVAKEEESSLSAETKLYNMEIKLDSQDRSENLDEAIVSMLRNISLNIKKGEFIAITGLIGSGKTSLLNAISGFMKRTSGLVNVNGSILLCGTPWIQNTTVKHNILFGTELNEQKYSEVIYACSLEADIKILPAGDGTEIGERGITLSGGQKARINFARAVYSDKEIVLMDDVLSAVDARVGKHIMNHCILGLLKNKTRLLATHQLSLIGAASRVIFMNGDGTIDFGTIDELNARNKAFKNLMAYNAALEKEDEEEKAPEVKESMPKAEQEIEKQSSIQITETDEEDKHLNYQENENKDGKLIIAEKAAENQIKWKVYKNYIKYGSGIFKHYTAVPILILLTVLAVFCMLFTNTWLSFWSELRFANMSNGFYIGIYVMFTFLGFLFLCLEFWCMAYIVNEAAVTLNREAVKAVLRVPMSYMDITPMGRMLNRFTKDTDVLENLIGTQLRMLVYFFSMICGVLILCVIYLPWFAIAIPPLGAIFVALANFYQASAREIKRLEATQRSLVYNNFEETLSGMDTLKALKKEDMFLEKNNNVINRMNEAYYLTISNQRWLSIALDLVACVMCLVVSLLCVFRMFQISASSVGLIMSYQLQIASQLSMVVKMYTQVENEMNSVERMLEYALDLPQEAPLYISETEPHPSWPEHGAILFQNASLAYRPGLPLVLDKLNADIRPAEKIGICGRTGAGKSSIMTALFRLSELAGGKIEIDGVNISNIGLHSLRSRLSIIPQDPVLFGGTIRKNLDPFDSSTDDELWATLVRSGMIEKEQLDYIKSQDPDSDTLHKFHLNHHVQDEGANYSLGEKQLISFARALVRGSKILILDEATSCVDYETDSKIQQTIVREFSHCTILCIAHRLKTIVKYDRIMVLDKGKIVEFDTPWNLYKSAGSIFQQMCERSNIVDSDFE